MAESNPFLSILAIRLAAIGLAGLTLHALPTDARKGWRMCHISIPAERQEQAQDFMDPPSTENAALREMLLRD